VYCAADLDVCRFRFLFGSKGGELVSSKVSSLLVAQVFGLLLAQESPNTESNSHRDKVSEGIRLKVFIAGLGGGTRFRMRYVTAVSKHLLPAE